MRAGTIILSLLIGTLAASFSSAQVEWEDPSQTQIEETTPFSPDESIFSLYLRARQHEQRKEIDQAILAFQQILELKPAEVEAHSNLARLFLDKGDADSAIIHAEAAIAIDPDNKTVLTLLARSYKAAGRGRDAIQKLESLVANGEGGGQAYNLLAILYKAEKKPKKAGEALEKAVEASPENGLFHYRLGQKYWSEGRLEEAETELLKALHLTDGENEILLGLARLSVITEDWDTAAERWEEVAMLGFRPREAQQKLAVIYMSLGREEEALTHAEALKELDPTDLSTRRELADLYERLGMQQEARQELGVLWKANPEDWRIPYRMVSLSLDAGTYRQAIATLRKILALNRNDLWAWTRLAYAFYELNEGEKSEMAVQAAVRLDPNNRDAYTLLGDAFALGKADEKALVFLGKAFDLGVRSDTFLFRKGIVEERNDRIDDATQTLKELIRINPTHAAGLNFLGYMLADHGRSLVEAEDLINRALQIEPDNPFFVDSLGWLHFRKGRFESAVKELERAAALLSNDVVVGEHLGDAYLAAGRIEDAQRIYSEVLADHPTNTTISDKLEALDHAR